MAWGPRVGRWQRQLPGVEYLLWVAHKVGNQQMHKSLQLNFTRSLQAAPQSFIHLLLILWVYSCLRHVPNLSWSSWPLSLRPPFTCSVVWMVSSWPYTVTLVDDPSILPPKFLSCCNPIFSWVSGFCQNRCVLSSVLWPLTLPPPQRLISGSSISLCLKFLSLLFAMHIVGI